jgi:hypothetical protein
MTREEHIAALEKYRDGIRSGGISVPYDDLMIALDAAITALRGSDTGLMPCGRKIRIDIPPENDSVRASTGFQRDGGDKTERRCNQCVHCGQEMPEGDQVCGYCRRKHGY